MHSKSASLSEPSSICTMDETFYLYSLAWWHSASLSEPSSICTMDETFYLYSLAWWHCIGIKKHVLCNSSDNIILSKDIPKTPPKPSFRITLNCYSWTLWWISMTFAFLVLRSPRCEDLITLSQHHSLLCLTFFFLNEKSYITQLSIVTCCKNWSPGVFFSEEKQLIRSHSSTVNLYRSHTLPCRWIISSLPIFFSHNAHLCIISLFYSGIFVKRYAW